MATGDMEVLLEVNKFDVDRDVEMTMIQAYIDIQKGEGWRSISSEFDMIAGLLESGMFCSRKPINRLE